MGADATVGTLKALISAEMQVPEPQQVRTAAHRQTSRSGLVKTGLEGTDEFASFHKTIDGAAFGLISYVSNRRTHNNATQQTLLKDGQPLRSDDAPLSACGVADNDFLFLMRVGGLEPLIDGSVDGLSSALN